MAMNANINKRIKMKQFKTLHHEQFNKNLKLMEKKYRVQDNCRFTLIIKF